MGVKILHVSNKVVSQMKINKKMSVNDMIKQFSGSGVLNAGRLADAVDIYKEMMNERVTKFLGLAGPSVPAGLRYVISDMIYDGMIDVLVTTGANLVHDVIEAIGEHHFVGTDDVDDNMLRRQEVYRMYDIYLPSQSFASFEKFVRALFESLEEGMYSISEFIERLGHTIEDEKSIIKVACECDIPIFCPAFSDSMFGLHTWLCTQDKKIILDSISDIGKIVDICYSAKKTGAMLIGGGTPKNFILQSMMVTPKSFDYAIQLTTDRPEAGGLSGATLSEAKSWGKVAERGRAVTVYGDATISLPIIVAAVIELMEH